MATSKHFGWEVSLIIVKVLFLLFVLAVAWVLYDIAKEGYSSWFMARFESEPKEGWDYWHSKRIKELLPEWLGVGAVALIIVSGIIWSIFRSFRRLTRSLPNSVRLQ
jgi:hypothetical protein